MVLLRVKFFRTCGEFISRGCRFFLCGDIRIIVISNGVIGRIWFLGENGIIFGLEVFRGLVGGRLFSERWRGFVGFLG